MISLAAFLFVIGILVFIHELGHFTVAKLFDVRVEKFSLGFGKKLLGFTKGETEYLISLLPLGGYVKMYGEGEEYNIIIESVENDSPAYRKGFRAGDKIKKIEGIEIEKFDKWNQIINLLKTLPSKERTFEIERNEEIISIRSDVSGLSGIIAFTEKEYPRSFSNKPKLQRFLIVVAGPIMNFILPFVFLPIAFMAGISEPAYLEKPPVVGYISEDSPAEKAGFKIGDKIISIEGDPVDTWREVNIKLQSNPDRTVEVVVERNGKKELLLLKTEASPEGLVSVGLSEPLEARVGDVIEGSPAHKAGLKRGDKILKINDIHIKNWTHMAQIIQKHAGRPLTLTIKRNGDIFNVTVTPEINPQTGKGAIGITLYREVVTKKYGFIESIFKGFQKAAEMVFEVTVLLLGFIFKLVTGQIGLGTAGKSIAGPLFIAKISGSAAQGGIAQLLQFTSFISINLAVINLLPIPMLDGGHVMYIAIETIKGKPLSRKTLEITQRIGFAFLMLIMFMAIYNDITRLTGGIGGQIGKLIDLMK